MLICMTAIDFVDGLPFVRWTTLQKHKLFKKHNNIRARSVRFWSAPVNST